jgi:hypothetical protein
LPIAAWLAFTALALAASPWLVRVFARKVHFGGDLGETTSVFVTGTEGLPFYVAPGTACVWMALAIAVWYEKIGVSFAFSLAYASLGGLVLFGYLRVRRTQARSAAVLRPRSIASFVPYGWFVLAVAAAFSPLLLVKAPGLEIPAIVVTFCSLVTILVAAQLGTLPAMLAGDRPVIEARQDNRRRCVRTRRFLTYAYMQPFFFFLLSGGPLSDNRLRAREVVLEGCVLIAFAAFTWWSRLHEERCSVRDCHGT